MNFCGSCSLWLCIAGFFLESCFFLRVREARLGGIEGNSARLKKVYLARDIELLNCWMFCPAADVTLFCISHDAFLLGFHGEKVLL